MTRIVVQQATGRAGHSKWSRLLLAAAFAAAVGCGHRVHLAPDPRIRPCGTVVDAVGGSLDRSQVSWMSPDDVNDRAKLDAWCNTVGPVVVHQPRPPVPPRADRLVVVGWNVHLGAGDVVRLVADLRAGRIDRKTSDAPLVLLLQETFRAGETVPPSLAGAPIPRRLAPHGTSPRRSALELAAALGLNVYYLPTMRNGHGAAPDEREDRGLAILSTLPLSDLQAIELPLERQRRPAAAATIRLDTPSDEVLNLRLVNVHLESRTGARRLWVASPQARNRQAEALTAILSGDVPTLLEGDLNTWAYREPLLEHLARELTPCTDRRPTYGGGLRLDWFFARLPDEWTMTCRRLDRRYGSDHYPLVAILEERRDTQRQQGRTLMRSKIWPD
jgi:endonuclease/exonuclease/phosphatase family metal-dependent hydrolase